jgi:hypothetical protein
MRMSHNIQLEKMKFGIFKFLLQAKGAKKQCCGSGIRCFLDPTPGFGMGKIKIRIRDPK